MPYTISSSLDVNAQVDVGNLRFNTNTISTMNTDGDILLIPGGDGNVGIINLSPTANLHISSITGKNALLIDGDPGISHPQLSLTDSTVGAYIKTNNTSTSYYSLMCINGSNIVLLCVKNSGQVGIGTTDAKAKLHVNGTGDSGTSLASASRKYFIGTQSGTSLSYDTYTSNFGTISIYANQEIVTSSWFISHGSSSYSDTRIKKDIVDIDDATALETIRLIKPKKYSYVDTVLKGSEPVWGFIAQEVKSTLDYAVNLMEKAIPNVYCNATVVGENYDMLELSNFDTANLQYTEGTLLTKLNCKTWDNREIEVTIEEILSSSKIRLSKPLESNDCNSGDGSIVDTIFVYGQIVSDFHVLKKDAIFTVAVAALQEIDRRQVEDNQTIVELETENALQAETIATLQDQVATLQAQVSALLQHTGVTV